MEQAQTKAEAVLKLKNIEVKVKWDAYEILSQTSIALGDSLKAESAFKRFEKAPIDKLAAEAIILEPIKTTKIRIIRNPMKSSLNCHKIQQPYWAAKVYY